MAAQKNAKKKFSINKLPQVPEGFSKANEKREACQHCGLFKRCHRPWTTPDISDEWNGKLLLITDPLSKESARITQVVLHEAGFRKRDYALLSPLRCAAFRKPKMSQIRACRPFLLKALEVLKPKYVLGLGATALRALTNKSDANITKARGKEIRL